MKNALDIGAKKQLKTALGLIVKQEKYEALNKELKKWLLILHIENVQVNGSLFKENTLEFANELNIKGFQTSEGWLKNEKQKTLRFGNFQLIFTIAR